MEQVKLLHVVVLGPHVGTQLPTHKIYKGYIKNPALHLFFVFRHLCGQWSLVNPP
jgi:hypothetical protein